MKYTQPETKPLTLIRASITVMTLSLPLSLVASAQRSDVAITYNAQRSLRANSGQNFWMQGGSIELGIDLWRGWGLAADLTGTHTNSIGSSNIPISLVTETFGPRYRWSGSHHISLYGQGLIGGAQGFHSLFPGPTASRSSAKSLAVQLGGGLDYKLTTHFGLRVIEAGWLRTQLPNSPSNVQNILRVGAGVNLRF